MSKLECAHMKRGACYSCLDPTRPKYAKYLGDKRSWGLLFRTLMLKSYPTLHKLLAETAKENWDEFLIVAPNGVKLSIEVGRMI